MKVISPIKERYAKRKRLYTGDFSYFKTIDTEEKAYWTGFITADGTIWSKDYHYTLRINLHKKDAEHLRVFKKALNLSNPVKHGKTENVYIECHSKALLIDLQRHGIITNRISNITMPKLTKEFTRHYIRGYFDGDGSVYIRDRQREKKTHTLYFFDNTIKVISGSLALLEGIKHALNSEGIKTRRIWEDKYSKAKQLLISSTRENTRRFYTYLYQDATAYLKRKKETFEVILKQGEK